MSKKFWLWVYLFSGDRLRRVSTPIKPPTVEELEAMLQRGDDGADIVALPNGSLIAV